MYRHEIATGQFGMVSARVKMSLGEFSFLFEILKNVRNLYKN